MRTHLDVLQGQILRIGSAVDLVLGFLSSDKGKQLSDSCDQGIHVKVNVVASREKKTK